MDSGWTRTLGRVSLRHVEECSQRGLLLRDTRQGSLFSALRTGLTPPPNPLPHPLSPCLANHRGSRNIYQIKQPCSQRQILLFRLGCRWGLRLSAPREVTEPGQQPDSHTSLSRAEIDSKRGASTAEERQTGLQERDANKQQTLEHEIPSTDCPNLSSPR